MAAPSAAVSREASAAVSREASAAVSREASAAASREASAAASREALPYYSDLFNQSPVLLWPRSLVSNVLG